MKTLPAHALVSLALSSLVVVSLAACRPVALTQKGAPVAPPVVAEKPNSVQKLEPVEEPIQENEILDVFTMKKGDKGKLPRSSEKRKYLLGEIVDDDTAIWVTERAQFGVPILAGSIKGELHTGNTAKPDAWLDTSPEAIARETAAQTKQRNTWNQSYAGGGMSPVCFIFRDAETANLHAPQKTGSFPSSELLQVEIKLPDSYAVVGLKTCNWRVLPVPVIVKMETKKK